MSEEDAVVRSGNKAEELAPTEFQFGAHRNVQALVAQLEAAETALRALENVVPGGASVSAALLLQARKALAASEARCRALLDTSSEGICHVDPHLTILYANRRLEELLGYESGALIGRNFADLVAPVDRPVLDARFERRKLGYPDRYDLRCCRKDGSVVWLLTAASPVMSDQGEFTGSLGMFTDITARHAAEETLRRAEAHFRALIERTLDVIAVLDPEGTVRYESPAVERVLGYRPEELVGQPAFALVHPDDLPRVQAVWEAGIGVAGARALVEYRARHKDGSWRVLESMASNLTADPAVGGIVVNTRDVTERAHALQALRESEERYRSLVAAIVSIVWILDTRGLPVEPSPGWEAYTGQQWEEYRNGGGWEAVHPTDREALQQARTRAMKRIEPYELQARFWHHPREAYRMCLIRGVPRSNPDGSVREWIETLTDVEDQRRAEEALHTSEEQLRQSQKMEAIGQLAGGVAHDFNNMLSVINGYSEILLERMPPGDTSRMCLAEILKAGERAAGLTRQLLVFSRRQLVEPRTLALNEVVLNVEKMLRRLIGEDIRLTTRLDPALGKVLADPGQVEQVLMNLAVNARDAMPQGGSLVLQTERLRGAEVQLLAQPSEPPVLEADYYVALSVTDTGSGMDAATQARIFEPFFTTKSPGHGTGLGLATVYGIVKQSGGHVEVYSAPGLGSTFRILLPEFPEPARGYAGEEPEAQITGGNETILLVEDEPIVRKLVEEMLCQLGYRVVATESPQEALEVCRIQGDTIQLLLTDVVMPDQSGRELAERVRERCPEVKVLFMTGYTDDALMRHGVMTAEVLVLQKPFSPAALARQLRAALDQPVSASPG